MDIEMLLVHKYNEDASVNYINLSIKVGWFWKHSDIALKQLIWPPITYIVPRQILKLCNRHGGVWTAPCFTVVKVILLYVFSAKWFWNLY
jgi:hypothetical protein